MLLANAIFAIQCLKLDTIGPKTVKVDGNPAVWGDFTVKVHP